MIGVLNAVWNKMINVCKQNYSCLYIQRGLDERSRLAYSLCPGI